MEKTKLALEINGERYEIDAFSVIEGVQDLLIKAECLEEGDCLEVLEGDANYIFHKY